MNILSCNSPTCKYLVRLIVCHVIFLLVIFCQVDSLSCNFPTCENFVRLIVCHVMFLHVNILSCWLTKWYLQALRPKQGGLPCLCPAGSTGSQITRIVSNRILRTGKPGVLSARAHFFHQTSVLDLDICISSHFHLRCLYFDI